MKNQMKSYTFKASNGTEFAEWIKVVTFYIEKNKANIWKIPMRDF